MASHLAALASAAGFLFFEHKAFAMCAMCKKTLEESSPGLIQGIYWSIILLAGIPLVIFCACAVIYIRLRRKSFSA